MSGSAKITASAGGNTKPSLGLLIYWLRDWLLILTYKIDRLKMTENIELSFNFEYVDYRLDEWAKWARSGSPNVGYSHLSNIGKIMESGGVFVEAGKPSEKSQTNPQAEETDQLVGMLARHFPKEARALKDYYIERKATSLIAKNQKVAVRTVQDRIKCAKIWLDGRLSSVH